MAYQAIVIPVMIATPSDIKSERIMIRNAIQDWNTIHSKTTKIVLMAKGWDSDVAPETGDRPQSIINKRILSDCDLLIGVFGTRIGSPTGKESSGTVEEIKEHINAGKPAMLYFSDKSIQPSLLDHDQYEAVNEFRHWCKTNSVYRVYSTESEFSAVIGKDISIVVSSNEYLHNVLSQYILANGDIVPQAEKTPLIDRLSNESKVFLKIASLDDQGLIHRIYGNKGEPTFLAGKKETISGTARQHAMFRKAVNELLNSNLIEIHSEGEHSISYVVTAAGFDLADSLPEDLCTSSLWQNTN